MPTLDAVLDLIAADHFAYVAGAAFVAGFTRGLMGFGGAMIFVPATAAILGPQAAVASIWFYDLVVQAPLVARAWRAVSWRELWPLAVAASVLTPLGTVILVLADRDVLRWALSAIVLVFLGLVAAGWRARGVSSVGARAGVGALAGLAGGAVGMPGPPVILFYLSGERTAVAVRANMIMFFATLSFVTGLSLWGAGLLTRENATLAATLVWPFALGTWLGTRVFPHAGEAAYRTVAYGLVGAIALMSLPVFDALLGR